MSEQTITLLRQLKLHGMASALVTNKQQNQLVTCSDTGYN